MISKIRQMEIALGKEEKIRTPSEMKNLKLQEKVLLLKRPLIQVINSQHLILALKDQESMQPISFWDLLSKKIFKKI